jgi:transcriptional regulator with XRE-family HTH domain
MGSARPKPARLAEKLLAIRSRLNGGVSQNELIRLMHLEDELEQERVSKYERGVLEPPLTVLLQYAKVANIYLETIVDDSLDLPETLPSRKKSEGIKRQK